MKIKAKKLFNLYNFGIIVAIIFILVSLYMVFGSKIDISKKISELSTKNEQTVENENTQTEKKDNTQDEKNNNIQVVEESKGKEITEKEARKVAKKQFKELGESNVDKDELQVKEIIRSGENYYYIASNENTMEIRIKDGKITRINSNKVEE